MTATWAANTITISGTPTASGTFNYSIPLTGGCGNVNATGTITVNALNTAGTPSSSRLFVSIQQLHQYHIATTGATGIGAPTGLPAGVTATWAANTITISGTPTASGTFNYSIPLTGGCGTVNATGTITVNALIQREHHHQARLFVSIQLLHQYHNCYNGSNRYWCTDWFTSRSNCNMGSQYNYDQWYTDCIRNI